MNLNLLIIFSYFNNPIEYLSPNIINFLNGIKNG